MTVAINTRSLDPVIPISPTAATEQQASQQGNTTTEAGGFESQLRALLSGVEGSQVNEEELFAGIIQERLSNSKGASVAEDFATQFEARKAENTRSDGYVFVEKSAKQALADMVEVGHITEDEQKSIYKDSFASAQLDDNLNALYDGRGGPNDPTIAVSDLEAALLSARTAMEALQNGEVTPAQTAADESTSTEDTSSVAPEGTKIDGADEFVFKPESESDKKLVIILPKAMTGKVEDLLLKDEDGNILERGRGSGVANGDREHFRFDRSGGDHPNNLTVEVRLSTGDIKQYEIPNPSERYD